MRDRNQAARALEAQFLRYREDGDVTALGVVFDGSATELERVARGLVRDRSEAEDLVQATFLTVIERAERWDKSERLMPWLLGILVNHAREARRKRAQTPEPDRLHERTVEEPPTALEGAEIRAALTQALSELSPDDRAVLEPVLHEGRQPRELARESGVALGTMRMRLSRALDRLRQRMPASAAFSALIPIPRSLGLEAVRSVVLSSAAKHAGVPVPVAVSTAAVIAGIVMTKKLVLVLSLLVVLVGAVWVAREFNAPRITGAKDGTQVARLENGAPSGAREMLQAADLSTPVREADLGDIVQVRSSAAAADATSKLIGRVLDHEGRIVAGCALRLFELRSHDLAGDPFALPVEAALANRVVRSRATTDADGRFDLAGGAHGATHFLSIGAGSASSSVQPINAALFAGEVRDLGDIVIERQPQLTGRVVDESGAPIPGVRVRAGSLVKSMGDVPLQSLLSGWRVLADDKLGFSGVWTPAPILTSFLAESIFSVNVTGEEGRFRVSPAGSDELVMLLDKQDWCSRMISIKRTVRNGNGNDEGDLVLSRGADLGVRVLDDAGEPVPDAEVRWGLRGIEGNENMSIVNEAGGLSASGSVVLRGVPDSEELVVAARRPRSLVWQRMVLNAGELAPVVLRLPEPVRLRVQLVDAANNAIPGGTVSIRPSASALSMQASGFFVVDALSPISMGSAFEFEGLSAGRFVVQVQHPRFGSSTHSITLEDGLRAQTKEIELDGRYVVLHVVDNATGDPLEGALVRTNQLLPGGQRNGWGGQTDANGDFAMLLEGAATIRVEHSGYARQELRLTVGESAHEVRLVVGGTLVVRVLDGEGQPRPGADVSLNRGGSFDGHDPLKFPLAGRTDARGEVEFLHLAEGDVTVDVFEPGTRTNNPLKWLSKQAKRDEPRSVAAYVKADRTNFVVIGGPNDLGLCEVTGRVTVQGQSSSDLFLLIYRSDRSTNTPTQRHGVASGGGAFSFRGLAPGGYSLSLHGTPSDGSGRAVTLHHRFVELETGEAKWIELGLELEDVRFAVVDPDGRALDGATITSHVDPADFDRAGELGFINLVTDATGRALAAVVGRGPWKVQVSHPGFGVTRPIIIDSNGREHRIELAKGIPVVISLEVGEASALNPDMPYQVILSKIGGSGQVARSVSFVGRKADAVLNVTEPGTYVLRVAAGGVWAFSTVILEIPESGLTNEAIVLTERATAGQPQ